MAVQPVQHTFYLAPYPIVRLILLIVAIIIEVLAFFNIGFGGFPLVPLGLAVFFLTFI
jgi:hypothetical protein